MSPTYCQWMAAKPGLIRPRTDILESSALRDVCSASRRWPLRRTHSLFPMPGNVEDSGEGLFESTSEVAPFDEGDRIGVVESSLRRYSDAPTRSVSQPFLFFLWGRTEWSIGMQEASWC
jgi:hypothetical protein